MAPEVLALGAAIFYASGGVTAKFGTQSGGILAGLPATLVSGILVVGLLGLFFVDSWTIPIQGAVYFGLAGLAGPGVGRLFLMRAVRDVGASVAVPVYSSSYPLTASLAAVVIFGEIVGVDRLFALLTIIAGIWACGRGGSANIDAELSLHGLHRSRWQNFVPLVWPLGAGAAFALSDVFRKFGLTAQGDPILGALIGLVAALLTWMVIAAAVPRLRVPINFNRSIGWFALSGVLNGLAQISLLFALQLGEISVVTPIVAAQPVMVVVLGALVLRGVEKLRPSTVIGALVVFAGVAFLSTT